MGPGPWILEKQRGSSLGALTTALASWGWLLLGMPRLLWCPWRRLDSESGLESHCATSAHQWPRA